MNPRQGKSDATHGGQRNETSPSFLRHHSFATCLAPATSGPSKEPGQKVKAKEWGPRNETSQPNENSAEPGFASPPAAHHHHAREVTDPVPFRGEHRAAALALRRRDPSDRAQVRAKTNRVAAFAQVDAERIAHAGRGKRPCPAHAEDTFRPPGSRK